MKLLCIPGNAVTETETIAFRAVRGYDAATTHYDVRMCRVCRKDVGEELVPVRVGERRWRHG